MKYSKNFVLLIFLITSLLVFSQEDPTKYRKEKFSLLDIQQTNQIKKYLVSVGSFKNATNANSFKDVLLRENNKSFVIINGNGLYRVIIESFNDYDSANKMVSQLKGRFNDAFILVNEVSQNSISRNPDTRKDFANVFYNKQYTLFDLLTDEPIFLSEDGKFHIYIASNENKKPVEFIGNEDALKNVLMYKFKNYKNCKDWCDGIAYNNKTNSDNQNSQQNKVATKTDITNKNKTENIDPKEYFGSEQPVLSKKFLERLYENTLLDYCTFEWYSGVYSIQPNDKFYVKWDGKKKIIFNGIVPKIVLNGIGNCSIYSNDELVYKYTGNIINGKFEGKGVFELANNWIYRGNFINSLFDGKSQIEYIDGSLVQLEFKQGYREGEAKIVSKDNFIINGNFEKDIFDLTKVKISKIDSSASESIILLYSGSVDKNMRYNGNGILYGKSNQIYNGQFQNGLKNGEGVYTKQVNNNKMKLACNWRNDLPNGEGKLLFNDTLYFSGTFKDGNYIKGTMYHSNGKVQYTGEFENRKYNGYGKLYREDGTKLYEGDFKNDRLCGIGKLYSENEKMLYNGEIENNYPNGEGTIIYGDGSIYIGTVKDGLPNGIGKLTDSDGKQIEANFIKGTFNYATETLKDGTKYEGEFANNSANGKGVTYFANGDKHEGEYKNGFPNGYGTYTFSDGTYETGEYVNGTRKKTASELKNEEIARKQQIEEERLAEKQRINQEKEEQNRKAKEMKEGLEMMGKVISVYQKAFKVDYNRIEECYFCNRRFKLGNGFAKKEGYRVTKATNLVVPFSPYFCSRGCAFRTGYDVDD